MSKRTFLESFANFNSQPLKEADDFHGQSVNSVFHFNSQPLKEADVVSPVVSASFSIFQLTASQGG